MPITDTITISPEVSAKYLIVSNAFKLDKVVNAQLDTYTNEPKDEINTEIGDTKQTEFYPQVKLCRWSNETNFSVRLIDTEYEKAVISTDKEKIVWDKDNIKIEFYDIIEGEGGYKMIPYLKEKPATNQIRFSVKRKGLDFFKQPSLTKEYKNGYSDEFQKDIVVSETQVKDLDGNILIERPIDIVNSFAIYHSTKGGMNDINGKDYKVGKAFHDKRPHFFDAKGLETWGDLDYIWFDEENGERIVTIPQDFLDKAVYPIKSNDTIGYSTTGGNGFLVADNLDTANNFIGGKGTTGASGGNIDNLYVYIYSYTAGSNSISTKINIYNYTSDTDAGTTAGVSNEIEITSAGLKTLTPSGTITLGGSTNYFITYWGDRVAGSGKEVRIAFDFGAGKAVYKSAAYTGSFPSPLTGESGGNYGISIYATYTPSGGGATNRGWVSKNGWF